MSAAGKLRALDKQMRNARTRMIVTTPAGYELFVTASDALPQLLAVVEAAENRARAEPELTTSRKHADTANALAAALAALDEALA